MILKSLETCDWEKQEKRLVMASLLGGDPLVLVSNDRCAKTHLACRIAEALRERFLMYDAYKAMFEDVLGYPNVDKLKQGVVEYVPKDGNDSYRVECDAFFPS